MRLAEPKNCMEASPRPDVLIEFWFDERYVTAFPGFCKKKVAKCLPGSGSTQRLEFCAGERFQPSLRDYFPLERPAPTLKRWAIFMVSLRDETRLA
jgi:hypothetical protein